MGIRGRGGSDRLRTTWTPEMDRYFIDLMLEQVHKGNRVDDRLFSKTAWEYMTADFNEKFKVQSENDILKNRHKTLRNLFRAITNILAQKGFKWDETRNMVIADNKVWDDYIKVHPDARSFRVKTIPFFMDLCMIYKNSGLEGNPSHYSEVVHADGNASQLDTVRSSEGLESPATTVDDGESGDSLPELSSNSDGDRKEEVTPSQNVSLHEIAIDEDFSVSMSKTSDDLTPPAYSSCKIGTRSRTTWQTPMDRYFIDLMLEHVEKGNQVDGLFHRPAWLEMLASFNSKFGFNYDVDILKNRYKTLRRQYTAVNILLGVDGFSWDDTRQMVAAEDSVWQEYIKVHTEARPYMTKSLPYYKDLCVICRNLSGDRRETPSGYNFSQGDEVKYIRSWKGAQSPAASASSDDDQTGDLQEAEEEFCYETNGSDQKSKRPLESPPLSSNFKKARGANDEGFAIVLREMATAVSSLADKKKEEDEPSSVFCMENVVHAIQALPDMDEELILDACELVEDEKMAKTFMALDVKLRKKWLIRKLRPQGL